MVLSTTTKNSDQGILVSLCCELAHFIKYNIASEDVVIQTVINSSILSTLDILEYLGNT